MNSNKTGIRQEVDTVNSSKQVMADAGWTPEMENCFGMKFSIPATLISIPVLNGLHYRYQRVAA
jgi:hypothetical protein